MRWRGLSKRVRSPRAATVVTATVHCTPRRAWSAATTGGTRQGVPCAWRSCARRCRRSVGSLTARTYAWHTMCGAGVGQTPAERHRRWAGFPAAWPVERMSCRRTKACRRHVAAVRARSASARARHSARMASSSTLGTETGVRSPERIKRARWSASRRSVLTRSPAFFGSQDGATPQPSSPFLVRERESPEPHGPASETKPRRVAFDGRCRIRGSRSHGRVPMAPRELTAARGSLGA
jgi:hypothetical protein